MKSSRAWYGLAMTALSLELATVETPRASYAKARVEMSDGQLIIQDRRREVLETIDAEQVDVGPGRWSYGPDVLVTKASGCACGGTRISPKA